MMCWFACVAHNDATMLETNERKNDGVHSSTECSLLLLAKEIRFPVSVQRRFRQECGQDPLDHHIITKWHKRLLQIGSMLRKKGRGKDRLLQLELKEFGKLSNAARLNPFVGLRRIQMGNSLSTRQN